MTEVWQQIIAVGAAVSVLNGAFLWAVKALLEANQKHLDARLEQHKKTLDDRLASFEESIHGTDGRLQRVELDLLRLREELAKEYVRRDDWIRFQTFVRHQIEALRTSFEDFKERMLDGRQ